MPVSRYWKHFSTVEITDTELGIPGEGTIRRWLRESPKGFVFTAVAPEVIAASGFANTKENKSLLVAFAAVAKKLKAKAVVFSGSPDFKPTPKRRAAIKAFAKMLPRDLPPAILDLPAWKSEHIQTATEKRMIPAYDPLLEATPEGVSMAYLRLPGPAGKRSRYDEASVEQLHAHLAGLKTKETFCVFCNIDMHVNAAALIQLMKKAPESPKQAAASPSPAKTVKKATQPKPKTTPPKKAPTKKAPTKKAPAKKATTKKAAGKKILSKRAPAKGTKAPAKKTPAKSTKAPAKKTKK